MKKIVPVILCGGSGTRLWPLSRKKTPKQFLKLMDNNSLLQSTAVRTARILGSVPDMVIITLAGLHEETARQLGEISPALTRHILAEPQARNTAAAVALAINYVQRKFGDDAYVWILPADHHVGDETCLKDAVHQAAAIADEGYMVTFGIEPTRAETGYGYIRKDSPLNGEGAHAVKEFVEKPNRETAAAFVATGEYLWSSGMHLFKVAAGRENFQAFAPETWDLVNRSLETSGSLAIPAASLYSLAKSEPFETAVMEKASRIAVIPCNPQWSDIGSWESLWEIRSKDDNGNAVHGNVFCQDTKDSMVLAHDRLVTCVGLKDVIIIETGDSILVADKKSNQSLKDLVGALQAKKRQETEVSATQHHSWGYVRSITDNRAMSLKEIVLAPGQSLEANFAAYPLQWMIAAGAAQFMIDGKNREAGANDTIYMGRNTLYSIANHGDDFCRLYELQYREAVEQDDALPHIGAQPAVTANAAAMVA